MFSVMHKKAVKPCANTWTTHLRLFPLSLALMSLKPWLQLVLSVCYFFFLTNLNNRKPSLGHPDIRQAANAGFDRWAIMFYRRCKHNRGVGLAAVGARASKSAAWLRPYPGAVRLEQRLKLQPERLRLDSLLISTQTYLIFTLGQIRINPSVDTLIHCYWWCLLAFHYKKSYHLLTLSC